MKARVSARQGALPKMPAMKTVKAAKRERRSHRKAKDHDRRDDRLHLRALGGSTPADLMEQIRMAMTRLDLMAPWADSAPMILPVLKRIRHPYPPEAAPIHIQVPPGIPTGFGIDLGPAFSHVNRRLLEHWGVDEATLLGTALENLRRTVTAEPLRIERFEHAGAAVMTLSGQGWGSSLVLLPDVLTPLLGTDPRVLLTPVRNSVVALPDDVDPEIAFDIWDALAHGAHDELDVQPLRWTGSTVTTLMDRQTQGLPN